MMSTHRRTWQRTEGRAAALFGVRRQVGSGSGGREDVTASDSTHPALFIESKLRQCHTTRTLHDEAKRLATKESKVPVLALFDKNRPGFLIVVHSDDLATVLAEFAAALDPEERSRLDALIRRAQDRARTSEACGDS
jgi:hypothetical protein